MPESVISEASLAESVNKETPEVIPQQKPLNGTESDETEEDLLTSLDLSSKTVENEDLGELDQKLIDYLKLLDTYTKTSNLYKNNYKNGFINLSRANYASNRRYNKDFYDHRPMDPVINVTSTDGKFTLVNNLELYKKEKKTKNPSDPEKEKFVDEKEVQEDENNLEEDEDVQLRNRKQPLRKKLDKDTSNVITKPIYKNPINMFGAFVPYQLRESQNCFNSAVEDSVTLVNLRIQLQTVYKEIKVAKKERSLR